MIEQAVLIALALCWVAFWCGVVAGIYLLVAIVVEMFRRGRVRL